MRSRRQYQRQWQLARKAQRRAEGRMECGWFIYRPLVMQLGSVARRRGVRIEQLVEELLRRGLEQELDVLSCEFGGAE